MVTLCIIYFIYYMQITNQFISFLASERTKLIESSLSPQDWKFWGVCLKYIKFAVSCADFGFKYLVCPRQLALLGKFTDRRAWLWWWGACFSLAVPWWSPWHLDIFLLFASSPNPPPYCSTNCSVQSWWLRLFGPKCWPSNSVEKHALLLSILLTC
jgi:hypothetical protein